MIGARRSWTGFLGVLVVSGSAFAGSASSVKTRPHELPRIDSVEHRYLDAVDVVALEAEDKRLSGRHVPLRVAEPILVDYSLQNAGTWEGRRDGGRFWRLRVSAEGASFMSFKFSDFDLPAGAELYFYSVYRKYQDGPYTDRHNRPARRFGSPMIPGDSALIELYLPEGAGDATLVIESVSHGYRNALGMGSFAYRDDEAAQEKELLNPPVTRAPGNFGCQRDINCPEGAPYQDEKRAVAEGYDGAYICSGQLINNVRQDNRYLYITASHCEWWRDAAGMAFYWNYENSGCGTNDYPPFTYSTGSTDLYHNNSTDINLLELDGTDLETEYNIYFMGFNRSTTAPTSAAMISFPDDKPKQITIDYGPITNCAQGGCGGGWGSNFWRVEDWEVGVDEQGSSGGGLMDQDHLLVGTLTGGIGTDCSNFDWDEFAKISGAWNSLKPFLDPDNTGAISVPGKDGSSPGCSGDPECDDGLPCNGAETCVAGSCQAGTPIDCDDANACTTDSCDPGTGQCNNVAISCDDADACTIDTCDAGTGCINTPIDCDDGDPCTTDSCTGGVCSNDPATPCCGDTFCDPGEDACNCALDCGAPPATETNCTDGIDEDCDSATDCSDADCSSDPACDVPTGEGFILSKNADFSTDDRTYDRTDTLYMLMWTDQVDFNDIKKKEWELKGADGSKVKQNFTNNFDITYTAQFDLLDLPSSETSCTWKGKVEDNNRIKYQPSDVITVLP